MLSKSTTMMRSKCRKTSRIKSSNLNSSTLRSQMMQRPNIRRLRIKFPLSCSRAPRSSSIIWQILITTSHRRLHEGQKCRALPGATPSWVCATLWKAMIKCTKRWSITRSTSVSTRFNTFSCVGVANGDLWSPRLLSACLVFSWPRMPVPAG